MMSTEMQIKKIQILIKKFGESFTKTGQAGMSQEACDGNP
jgi:hypothetical protein